ncbi:hypothetical protein NUM3379_06070 [Kineococcus sp. NUM-3379]
MERPLLILIAGPYRSGTGDDHDVAIAQERGLPVYFRLEDVPGCGTQVHHRSVP